MQSDHIEKLASALSKAQSKIIGATKNSANPFYNSTYADLEAVCLAIREPMATYELAVTQTLDQEGESTYLTTTLMHSSGQWISGRMKLIVSGRKDMQALGGAITYARRYSLAGIMGVPQVDDDANDCCNIKSTERKATPLEKLKAIIIAKTSRYTDTDKIEEIRKALGLGHMRELANKNDEDIKEMITFMESFK